MRIEMQICTYFKKLDSSFYLQAWPIEERAVMGIAYLAFKYYSK